MGEARATEGWRRRAWVGAAVVVLVGSGCGVEERAISVRDGGGEPQEVAETGMVDVALGEGGEVDVNSVDADVFDAGAMDAVKIDIGLPGDVPGDSGSPSTCPVGMALIPGGAFDMGSASGETDEQPVHRVMLSAFCMDTTEVTVTAYRSCPT